MEERELPRVETEPRGVGTGARVLIGVLIGVVVILALLLAWQVFAAPATPDHIMGPGMGH